MSKRKLIVPAILSIIGTSAYLISKKHQDTKHEHISQILNDLLVQRFGKEHLKGYWIDFENNQGLEYACGVNVENDSEVVDSYTFIFNPDSKEIYSFKIINTSFK